MGDGRCGCDTVSSNSLLRSFSRIVELLVMYIQQIWPRIVPADGRSSVLNECSGNECSG